MLKQHGYKSYTHSAIFVEVEVDEDFGTVSVRRIVSAIARGRIINHEAARDQIMGGMVWGIGMALQEQAEVDHQFGRVMNHNFAEYHVPVNADVHDVEVIFVKEEDNIVNPIGAKGLGKKVSSVSLPPLATQSRTQRANASATSHHSGETDLTFC